MQALFKLSASLSFTILALLCASVSHAETSARLTIELTDGWRFQLGDEPAASEPSFDDRSWRTLDLPHDWSFEAGVSRSGAQRASGGYYSGGIGWYRKTFEIPELGVDRLIKVEFDGVYMNSEVWINGHQLGRFPYGYLSFAHDLTPYLKPGKNTLAVRCDNSKEPSARWYHPCGIYAPVRLVEKNRAHISNVFVSSPSVTAQFAKIHVETKTQHAEDCQLSQTVYSPRGDVVALSSDDILSVKNPALWSSKTPQLYTLETSLTKNGKVIDRLQTPFGIRSIRWEAKTGFWLNDENVKLLGVCEHWEAGPVGGAWTPELLRWKLETLKSMGCNAIRTAHSPFPPFFYDLCDELGILVMDEIFDGWKKKAPHDYGKQAFAQHWEADLRSWIKRDRNHPCVVIWSVGNETSGPVASELVRICHELDPTRPVTSGHSGSEHMDVFGINGGCEKQGFVTDNHRPQDKPFVATEAPHTWQVRGYYRTKPWFRDGFPNANQKPYPLRDLAPEEIFTYDWTNPAKKANPVKQIFNSSYDNATVRISARKNWEQMRDVPWYSGHFRWTGFDYPGEAGYVHGGFPFRAFMGGTHDLAGLPKDLAYFYQSQWTDEPMVHLLPHWTHPKIAPDTQIPIWAYSNAEQVELFLNDVSLDVRQPGHKAELMQCEWLVPWKPGTLTVVASNGGKEVARTSHSTAYAPAGLQLKLESLNNGLRILTTTVIDASQNHAPYADNRIHVHLPKQARLYSHENGNPVDTENGTTTPSRRAFMGLTRSFLRANPDSDPATVAAILGSRNGVNEPAENPVVTIDVQSLPLSDKASGIAKTDYAVHFTIDGTPPTTDSMIYEQPFSIKMPTTVKALVMRDGIPIVSMSETFASDAGLHWIDPSEKNILVGSGGAQAEDAQLLGRARVATGGTGFRGRGYVDLSHRNDGIAWYQENDGTTGYFTLRFRYAQQDANRRRIADLLVNDVKVALLKFENTGSWDRHWKTLETTVELRAGANEILLRATPGGGPRIDELFVE